MLPALQKDGANFSTEAERAEAKERWQRRKLIKKLKQQEEELNSLSSQPKNLNSLTTYERLREKGRLSHKLFDGALSELEEMIAENETKLEALRKAKAGIANFFPSAPSLSELEQREQQLKQQADTHGVAHQSSSSAVVRARTGSQPPSYEEAMGYTKNTAPSAPSIPAKEERRMEKAERREKAAADTSAYRPTSVLRPLDTNIQYRQPAYNPAVIQKPFAVSQQSGASSAPVATLLSANQKEALNKKLESYYNSMMDSMMPELGRFYSVTPVEYTRLVNFSLDKIRKDLKENIRQRAEELTGFSLNQEKEVEIRFFNNLDRHFTKLALNDITAYKECFKESLLKNVGAKPGEKEPSENDCKLYAELMKAVELYEQHNGPTEDSQQPKMHSASDARALTFSQRPPLPPYTAGYPAHNGHNQSAANRATAAFKI